MPSAFDRIDAQHKRKEVKLDPPKARHETEFRL